MDALARASAYVLTLLALLLAAVCGPSDVQSPAPEALVPQKTIEQVLAAHTDRLLAIPGVVGTAQGECDGAPCVNVLVSQSTAALREQIPPRLEGYPVEIIVTGRIRALGSN